MSQYSMDHLPPIPPESAMQVHSLEPDRTYLVSAFAQMGLGLVLTALTAFIFLVSGGALYILSHPTLSLMLLVAQLGIAVAFGVMMQKASANTLRLMFFAYALLTGITFSSLGLVYTGSTLFYAFVISAVFYFCLAFVGLTTKRNLNNLGLICLVGLVVLMISSLVLALFGAGMNIILYSAVGLILFTGITCWDVQRMKTIMATMEGDDASKSKWTVYFALELYLDFINIFLYVLRLFAAGSGSNSRR